MERCISNVLNCDCLAEMRKYSDKHFNIALVDAPYGIGRDGGETGKNWKLYEQKAWDEFRPGKEYWNEIFRISKNQIIWGANYFVEHLPPSMGWVFWDKGQNLTMSDGELAFTSFNRALRRVEINRCFNGDFGGLIHPTQKPVKLYKWLLKNYAKEGDRIVDPFVGSGSSRIAAYDGGFEYVGYELDTDYFNAQEKRFAQHKSQLKLFV